MATLTGTNPQVVEGPVMAPFTACILNGQSWSAGQFLYVDTSGLLKVCADAADSGTGGVKYYAFTAQADPGNSTTSATVGIVTREHTFQGNVYHGTASSAVATTALLGQAYALKVSTTDYVDISDTGNDAFEVVDIGSQYEPIQNSAADVYGRVKFKVLTAVLEAASA